MSCSCLIVIAVDSSWYPRRVEIDLNDKNFAAFEKAVSKYVAAGRKVRGGAKARSTSKPSAGVDLGAVRAWAKDAGYEVSDRGRVSSAVLDAYKAAN